MSFQTFSKLPNIPRHRSKNLPTPQFISFVNSVCEGTPNKYLPKRHQLLIFDTAIFTKNLKNIQGRSYQSFCKQLKFLGFKKQKQVVPANDKFPEEKFIVKYFWNGLREQQLAKEIDLMEQHLVNIINTGTKLKTILQNKRNELDESFEKAIFWGLNRGATNQKARGYLTQTVSLVHQTINFAHRSTGQIANDIQMNSANQLEVLRLLTYRQNDLPAEEQ